MFGLVSTWFNDGIALIALTEAEMASLFKDPICGHEVDPATAFASEEHDGRTYYFDSRECHYEFLADPHRYGHVHSPDDPRLEQDEITGP